MALRTIRLADDELLRKKSKPVRTITQNIKMLLDDMLETMRASDGLGLAAPQVGVLKRLVVIEVDDEVYELINPEIIEQSGEQTRYEGCLSLPGKSGMVTRPGYVKVKALNRDGEEYTIEGEELKAVALCHELDHLDGILYMDKAVEIKDNSELHSEDEYEDEVQ